MTSQTAITGRDRMNVPEVQLLGEYYPGLEDVRTMYGREAYELLESKHGYLANRFFYVTAKTRNTFRLRKGTGFLLHLIRSPAECLYVQGEPPSRSMLHAVVFYRGLDGDYCFFDSTFSRRPCDEIVAAARRSGPGQMYWCDLQYGLQGVGMNTCQYYCVAFMTFVARHSTMRTGKLIPEFIRYLKCLQPDRLVVNLTQKAYDEARVLKSFTTGPRDLPVHAQSLQPRKRRRTEREPPLMSKYLTDLTQAQVKPRKRRRTEGERPVISKYLTDLTDLTQAQVKTLLANVTVVVVKK